MASPSFAPYLASRQRISFAAIDTAVSARLGPTRRLGNSQPACFNPQVAMYLAKNVGRWTTTIIGRFYNGRNHSTVCYGIQRIEALRKSDPDVDGFVTDLRRQLMAKDTNTAGLNADDYCSLANSHRADLEDLAELIAARSVLTLKSEHEHCSRIRLQVQPGMKKRLWQRGRAGAYRVILTGPRTMRSVATANRQCLVQNELPTLSPGQFYTFSFGVIYLLYDRLFRSKRGHPHPCV